MRVWLKFVMACLLALALPAQGLTNATMLHCGSSHQRMHNAQPAPVAEHQAHQAAGSHHPHGADHAVDHITDHTAPADHGTASPDTPETPDKVTDLGQYKCSACASCCAGLALLSSMPRVGAPERGTTVFLTVMPTVGAFATDGPDRPPRTSLV